MRRRKPIRMTSAEHGGEEPDRDADAGGEVADHAGDDGDDQAADVVAEDRAPRGVAAEQHVLAGREVHGCGQPTGAGGVRTGPWASAYRPSLAACPSIARVEPLTTARTVRGPFDYLLPTELGRGGRGLAARRALRPPAGARRRARAGRPQRRAARAAGRAARGARARGAAPSWSGSRCGSPTRTARRPARALALVLPPGAGTGVAPRVRERTGAGRGADRGGAGRASGAGRPRRAAAPAAAAVSPRASAPCSPGSRRTGPLPATAVGADHGALRRLERRGLLTLERRALRRRPSHAAVGARRASPPALNAAQSEALAAVEAALGAAACTAARAALPAPRRHRLGQDRGLPAGRGRGARGRARRDRPGPEIALTPQTVARFRERFGEAVAVLHSGLRPGRAPRRVAAAAPRRGARLRRAALRRASRRSPTSGSSSSTRSTSPPTSTRATRATTRARWPSAAPARPARCCVAGSATPRPESRHRAARGCVLPERVDGRAAAAGRDASTCARRRHALHPRDARGARRRAPARARRRSCCSTAAAGRTSWPAARAAGRGRARSATSRSSCTAAQGDARLPPLRPPPAGAAAAATHCGSVSVARHGAGHRAPRARARRRARRPGFPVVRLDADAAAGRGEVERLLARFDAAPAGVLLGTQMVAKGHDFPAGHARRRARRRPHAALPGLPRRRSARSRSSPSSPAAPGAARAAAASSSRRSRRRRRRSASPPRTTPRASCAPSSRAARRCAIRRSAS